MVAHEIFQKRIEIMSVPLARGPEGLTHESSDMGPAFDRVARAVAYRAGEGLFLVDPGPEAAPGPTLQRFSETGRCLYRRPLGTTLALRNPVAFKAHLLFFDDAGRVNVVCSVGYDPEKDRDVDFMVARFRAEDGSLVDRAALPRFPDVIYDVSGSRDGSVWARRVDGATGSWAVYSRSGLVTGRIPWSGDAVLLPDDRLLAPTEEASDTATVYDARGRSSAVRVIGSLVHAAGYVAGEGAVVGRLTRLSEGEEDEAWGLQLLRVDEKPSRLVVLATGPIPFRTDRLDSRGEIETFETSDPGWLRLDAEGNLTAIIRRGRKDPAITVYRLALRPEILERVRAKDAP